MTKFAATIMLTFALLPIDIFAQRDEGVVKIMSDECGRYAIIKSNLEYTFGFYSNGNLSGGLKISNSNLIDSINLDADNPNIQSIFGRCGEFYVFSRGGIYDLDILEGSIDFYPYEEKNTDGQSYNYDQSGPYKHVVRWPVEQGYQTPRGYIFPFPDMSYSYFAFDLTQNTAYRYLHYWNHTSSILLNEESVAWARVSLNSAASGWSLKVRTEDGYWETIDNLPKLSSNYFLVDISGHDNGLKFAVIEKRASSTEGGDGVYSINSVYSMTSGLLPYTDQLNLPHTFNKMYYYESLKELAIAAPSLRNQSNVRCWDGYVNRAASNGNDDRSMC